MCDERAINVEPTPEFLGQKYDEEILCSICFLPFISPTQHNPCGITFCEKCIKKSNFNCPVCLDGPKRKEYTIIKAKFILNILGREKVKCDLCSEEMTLGNFEEHVGVCRSMVVRCEGKALGCGCYGKREDVWGHQQQCRNAIAFPFVRPLEVEIEALKEEIKKLKNGSQGLKKPRVKMKEPPRKKAPTRVDMKTSLYEDEDEEW